MSNNTNIPLLVVNQNVQDLQTIQNSSQGVSDYILYSPNLNISKTYNRVGLMYTNNILNTIPFFNNSNNIQNINNNSKYKFFSTELINFIKSIGCKTLDLITCSITNSLLISEIKDVSNDLSITINYSIDKTGNVAEGGDWIMEESVIKGNINNAVINIKPVYFNNNISSWTFLLDAMDLAPTVTVLNSKHIKRTLNADGISYTYKLTKSIYINNKNNPVLTLNVGDVFDGNHHTIIMKYDTIGILYCSGVTPDGVTATETVIKDLKVRCKNVTDVNDDSYGGDYVYPAGGGIICGSSAFFSVYNCYIYIKGNINNFTTGGICGSDCLFINNLSNCNVHIKGNNNGGGICGAFCIAINIITKCSVKINNNIGQYAGGIVGYYCENINTISKCYVYLDGDIENYSGGITASACIYINTISTCYVKINGNTGEYIGGICGSYNIVNNIINCTYTGIINNRSGGILGGYCNSYNEVDANLNTNISKCNVISNIKNNSGGIVGYDFGYLFGIASHNIFTNDLTINNCKVKGKCDSTSSGILAPIVISLITDSISNVTITGCKYIKSIYNIYPTISQNYTISAINNKKET